MDTKGENEKLTEAEYIDKLKRAQADFEINKKAEYEVETILAHLENQNDLLLELMKKVDKR